MNRLNNKILITFALLFAMDVTCFSNESVSSTNVFCAKVKVQLGHDKGQNLGTLFEIKNANGNLVLGAGFNSSAGTGLLINNRILEFYHKCGTNIAVKDLGLPFPDSTRPAVASIANELVAFERDKIGKYVQQGWRNMSLDLPGKLLNIQLVRNKPLYFLYLNPRHECAIYERKAIVKNDANINIATALFYDNVIYIAGNEDGDFVVRMFRWNPYESPDKEAVEIKRILAMVKFRSFIAA